MDFETLERESRETFLQIQQKQWWQNLPRNLSNWLIDSDLNEFLSVICGVFGFCSAVTTIIILCVSLQSEGSWIDKSFSLGISFAITSLFLGIMPAIFLLKNQLKFEPAQLAPRTTITFSIQHKLKAMEQETIGELSRFHSLYQELQAMKENSMQDAEFLRERISRHDSRYLKTSLEEAEASISIANAALAKLASFKAKVVEFLQRSLNSVREMEPYLIELEVVERVHANKLRAQELAKEAQIEIIAAVQTLQNKISRVQSEITARFKAIGINLALNAHNSENLVRDLENIERTLEEFAEAQII